ncbi:MAG: glycosyltransferase family 2 protein [Pirellulales bacterium]
MTTISVIIPAHDAAETLGETLASVRAQSRSADEVIVVDDGSSDDTAMVATAGGAAVVRQAQRGVAAALNAGLQATQGDFVAFLDADDLWEPDCLRAQERHLAARADLAGSVGRFSEFPCPTLSIDVAARFVPRENEPAWLAGGMLLRRWAFDRAGFLDESIRVGAWIEWIDRARHAGCTFDPVDRVVLRRRLRPGTLSQSAVRNASLLTVARAALARRRPPST